jgi:hypothetical protein
MNIQTSGEILRLSSNLNISDPHFPVVRRFDRKEKRHRDFNSADYRSERAA